MATAVMSVSPLVPRPSPRPIAVWEPPKHLMMNDGKENRPALKQLQQSAPAARSRKERPCDGCRRRKSKCVLQDSGRCVLCEFHKQECTFVENAQPRKRKVDDGTNKDKVSSSGRKNPSTGTTSPSQSATQSTTQSATAPSSPERQQIPQPQLSQPFASPTARVSQPFIVDESLSLQRHRHCKYLGQTTALDVSLIGLGTFDSKNETGSRVGTLRQVTDNEYFSTHADADASVSDDEVHTLAEIEATVGPHAAALIDIYFEMVHPSYPIIQKTAFLDRRRDGDRQFNPPLLAAMYLLAMSWWDTKPNLAQHPKPDVTRLEYLAISSLTVAMQRPKMSAVQAGLLLLQRAKSSTWTLTVQLVALGQDIGLHLDCTNWSIPLWERRLRKRLAWALYMQEKWSALVHGRPSHINAADWAVQPPTEDDFDESLVSSDGTKREETDPADEDSHVSKGRMLFVQMIALTAIMAEVCSTFYSQTASADFARAGRYATQLVLNRAKPVQIKLKDWFSKLPPECKIDSSTTGATACSPVDAQIASASAGYLHLAYFATEISIHRRIVQSLGPSPSPDSGRSSVDPYMLYICRSAAKTRLISAMDFLNRLTPAHLNAFWFFASPSNLALIGVFGALLQATSPGAEEAAFYASRLREYKWTLGVSARRAGWIQNAIEMVEASSEILSGLAPKPMTGEETFSLMDDTSAHINGYDGDSTLDGEQMEVDGWGAD